MLAMSDREADSSAMVSRCRRRRESTMEKKLGAGGGEV